MTMDERVSHLEEQTAALSVQALADTPAPSGYYTSRYSGEQIDNLLSGLGFEIGGSYANLAAIQAAFPNGDTHAYQARDTMEIYVWNAKTRAWESVGKLQGPVGEKGDKGDPGGPPGPQGERGPGSNPNLLDNWYFLDPINQRGRMEYSGGQYSIDRWYLGHSQSDKATITSGGIKLDFQSGEFIQRFERPILGLPLTLSVLLHNGELWTVSGTTPDNLPEGYYNVASLGRIHIGFYDGKLRVVILGGVSITVVAVKLELGTEQTLARQDADGNWVLNDPPPDKALELLKCQRYYLGFRRWEFWQVMDIQPSYVDFCIPIPVEMRAAPAITNLVSNWFDSSWSLSTAVNGRSVIRVRAYKENHGLTGPLSPVEAYDFSSLSADL